MSIGLVFYRRLSDSYIIYPTAHNAASTSAYDTIITIITYSSNAPGRATHHRCAFGGEPLDLAIFDQKL